MTTTRKKLLEHFDDEVREKLKFGDLLDAKVREFNPRYAEAEGALLGQFRHLHTDIYGNREFIEHLRNRGKFFGVAAKRERDLILIDFILDFVGIFDKLEQALAFDSDEINAKTIELIKQRQGGDATKVINPAPCWMPRSATPRTSAARSGWPLGNAPTGSEARTPCANCASG